MRGINCARARDSVCREKGGGGLTALMIRGENAPPARIFARNSPHPGWPPDMTDHPTTPSAMSSWKRGLFEVLVDDGRRDHQEATRRLRACEPPAGTILFRGHDYVAARMRPGPIARKAIENHSNSRQRPDRTAAEDPGRPRLNPVIMPSSRKVSGRSPGNRVSHR